MVPHPGDIRPGDMMLAKPKHFQPRPSCSSDIGRHPVIILTEPDAEGRVKVTTISHKHPESTPQRPTSWYGLPEHPITGEGTISVGKPKVIHYHQLKPASPPERMTHEYFALLLADIDENSL